MTLELIICPRCEGQEYDRDACALCEDIGLLDGNGDLLDGAELRLLLAWLESWQVNFPTYISQGEPVLPRRIYLDTTKLDIPQIGPSGVTG